MNRSWIVLFLCACGLGGARAAGEASARPNLLLITCEDLSPEMVGCFGGAQATTPHIDRLASGGVRYTRAFAAAPVCSPSRSGIILGMYAGGTGTQNLRSAYGLPARFRGFPALLREAGYRCTNNVKTDYNSAAEARIVAEAWDESSGRAHWRGRAAGQPFYAVFNIMTTHQSKGGFIDPARWDRPLAPGMHDPSRMVVPPYYPDTPTVRRTLANYHDRTTEMDARVGELLGELEADGLAGETIVLFASDHGTGLPRGKRTLYDSGLRVPLVIRFPARYAALAPGGPGSETGRLVSLLDLGPTLLSLAGIRPPPEMQGRAFLGAHAAPARRVLHGARDRVDEAFDLSRSVRDERFLYIRNYRPDLSWNAPEWFSDQAPMRVEITRLAREGRLDAAQLTYAGSRRAPEELYDTEADPVQVRNLAGDPAHRGVLERLRGELRRWLLEIRDTGFLPEEHLEAVTEAGGTPWDLARDRGRLPLERVLEAAELVGREGVLERQIGCLEDPLPAIRFWGVQGLAAAGESARAAVDRIEGALADPDPAVRVVAAAARLGLGDHRPSLEILAAGLKGAPMVATRAARALELLGERARPVLPAMREALGRKDAPFVAFALDAALRGLGEKTPPSGGGKRNGRGKRR